MDTAIMPNSTVKQVHTNRLQEIRRSRGRTLKDCGDACGVTPQAIYKAERRTDALAISKWKRLAAFLETPLSEIV